MIRIENLYKKYSTASGSHLALDDVNLSVAPKEIFGIIGRSGAGKSTLLRCVNWLEKPTRGIVRVAGQTLNELSSEELRKLRQEIGMIFQHFNLLSRRNVFANVALPLELKHFTQSEIQKRVDPLLDLVGLKEKSLAFPSELSGGQKQRVAIARALTMRPKVLLCDEMTSALDPETTQSILRLIKQINEEFHISILLITHEMDVIKKIADHVAVMDHGKIVEQGDVFQIFSRPKTAVAQSFVQSSLHMGLPLYLQQKLVNVAFEGADQLWQFTFLGEIGEKPIISQLLRQFDIDLNIIQAKMENVHGRTLGILLARVSGSEASISQAQEFLTQKEVQFEKLGYVSRND